VKNDFNPATKSMTTGFVEFIVSNIAKLSWNSIFILVHFVSLASQLSTLLFRLFPTNSDPIISLIRVNFVIASSSAVLSNSARVESISDIVPDTADNIVSSVDDAVVEVVEVVVEVEVAVVVVVVLVVRISVVVSVELVVGASLGLWQQSQPSSSFLESQTA
jgi:hypothetical protein